MTEDLSRFPLAGSARVATERPGRYGKQLANHMARRITTSWDDETQSGRLIFNLEGTTTGYVDMQSEKDTLVLTVFADEEHRVRIAGVVGNHLERFGAKDELRVEWVPA